MSHEHGIFLDHASTTPAHPDVVGLMLPFFGNHFGIPSLLTSGGIKARNALEEARQRVAALLGAKPGEIIFTSGATEANNLAVLGAVSAGRNRGRHLVVSAAEHASVLNIFRHLETRGFEVSRVEVDNSGRVDPERVRQSLRDDTILVSVQHANQETGAIQPVEEIGAMARERGILFHCDAVQSAGRVRLDMDTLQADLATISSHKLYGPKGAGALYIRSGTEIDPVIFGSGQERGLRPGTQNVACIAGFGLACSIALQHLESNSVLVTSLRESLEQQVTTRITGVRVNGSGVERLPHISSLSFEGVRADALAAYLDALDIVVSPRSTSGGPSPALAALGLDPEHAAGTVRVSFGWENKEREVRRTVEALERAAARARSFTRASRDRDVTVFTFPDREDAVHALERLDETDIDFSPVAKPAELMYAPCSAIALACLSSDQAEVGAILGEAGIALAGMHKPRPLERPLSRKARDFWDKVEQIRKKER
ncbi:MAG: cysteine desulfurase family protein [Desulfomonilia bacterium]|jgi:cysteine desulfurase